MAQEVTVKVHPLTSGIGILGIDGGGRRGTVLLKLMKRIEDRIQALTGLQTPLQTFCKHAFRTSSVESCNKAQRPRVGFRWWLNRPRTLYQRLVCSKLRFEKMVFKPRDVVKIAFLSRI